MEDRANDRVESILIGLAQDNAPQILQTWAPRGDYAQRVAHLSRRLAAYNILVIMGDFPQSLQMVSQDMNAQIQAWVGNFGDMYRLLQRSLFPSFTNISAHYSDDKWPVVIYIRGTATPVIQALAGFVVPFVVLRQVSPVVSEAELRGLMDILLEELEATDLPRNVYKDIGKQGIEILRRMLACPIRQMALADFDRPIFSDSQRMIAVSLPTEPPPPPPPPDSVPEEDSRIMRVVDDLENTRQDVAVMPSSDRAYNNTDTEQLDQTRPMENDEPGSPFDSPIPIFFERKRDSNKRTPGLGPGKRGKKE